LPHIHRDRKATRVEYPEGYDALNLMLDFKILA